MLVFIDCYSIKEHKPFAFAKPINPETLGEFTGLYDKNGERMFEGDIVKARMTDKYTVVFNRGSFMGEYTSAISGCTVRVDLLKDDWEVIGNIYDNPELLGQISE